MQKKIIALAVAGLVSGGAFAQSSVTISGVLDVGVQTVKKDNNNGATENGAYNGSATSSVWIRAEEDLGGGLKAGAALETQPASSTVGNDLLGGTQRFVWIGGNFGTLAAGKKNTLTLKSLTTIQPFGVNIGSGYGNVQTADTRHDAVIGYDSPNFNGFTVGMMYKFKNENHVTAADNNYGYLNLGANYNNGPLNVTFAHSKQKTPNAAVTAANGTYLVTDNAGVLGGLVLANATAAAALAAGQVINAGYDIATTLTAATAGSAASLTTLKNNVLGGNYTFGAFTVYAGLQNVKGDISGATNVDKRMYNMAGKWMASSNIAVMANYAKGNDKTVADADTKLYSMGADYLMSKRTAAYVRYENRNMNTNVAGNKVKTTAVGLRHSF